MKLPLDRELGERLTEAKGNLPAMLEIVRQVNALRDRMFPGWRERYSESLREEAK